MIGRMTRSYSISQQTLDAMTTMDLVYKLVERAQIIPQFRKVNFSVTEELDDVKAYTLAFADRVRKNPALQTDPVAGPVIKALKKVKDVHNAEQIVKALKKIQLPTRPRPAPRHHRFSGY